jgi:hypothetical protein
VLVEGVHGDLGAPGDHRGLELAAGAAPAAADLAVEDDLDGVRAAEVIMLVEIPRVCSPKFPT